MDLEKIGTRIASLRKERKLTGEALAERLQVNPQAVSKWENGRCLPETAILPALAEALGCSIDSLLCPGEFLVLEAIYTDGQAQIPVTAFVNGLVRDNGLNILVKEQFLGVSLPGGRLKVLTIKYQTPALYWTGKVPVSRTDSLSRSLAPFMGTRKHFPLPCRR